MCHPPTNPNPHLRVVRLGSSVQARAVAPTYGTVHSAQVPSAAALSASGHTSSRPESAPKSEPTKEMSVASRRDWKMKVVASVSAGKEGGREQGWDWRSESVWGSHSN